MNHFYICLYLFSALFFGINRTTAPQTIKRPSFAARTTTAITIDSIQRKTGLTRLYITLRYFPNKAVTLEKEIRLTDFKGHTSWKATDMEGGDLGRRIMIPESGKMALFIDFPAIPASVRYVDLINTSPDFPFKIIDISLFDHALSADTKQTSLTSVQKQQSGKRPQPGTSVVHVQLNGYHTRLGIDTALFIETNLITEEQKRIPTKIDSAGRFSVIFPQSYPQQHTLFLPYGYIHFYSEPGDELFISAELDEMAIPYQKPEEAELNYTHLRYEGDQAKTNQELKTIRTTMYRLFPPTPIEIQGLSAQAYKQKIGQLAQHQQQALDSLMQALHIGEKAAGIARKSFQCSVANRLFDFEYKKRLQKRAISLPPDYYRIDLMALGTPSSLFATEYLNLIDRLELSQIMDDGKKSVTGNDVIAAFYRLKIPLTSDEQELIRHSFSMKTPSDTADISDFHRRTKAFNQQYPALQLAAREQALLQKYHSTLSQTMGMDSELLSEILYGRRVILSLYALKRALSDKELSAFYQPVTQQEIRTAIQSEYLKSIRK